MLQQETFVDDVWADDVLSRKAAAASLSKYLCNRYADRVKEDGFVVAIDAEWGHGKTFMLDRWRYDLIEQGHPVVFFDAWKNDFTPEPLVAFISELNSGLEPFFKNIPKGKRAFKVVLNSLKRVLKPAAKAVAFATIKQLSGMDVDKIIGGASNDEGSSVVKLDISEIGKSLNDAVSVALKEHQTKKQAILDFKDKLGMLIDTLKALPEGGIQLPIFVFIDELDRCRPNYAIELLEGVKHLFGVRGIYFVVATNVVQLGESVKAIYGPGFNGASYLKRFFDLEYSLPEPSNINFANSLFEKISIPGNMIIGLERISEFNLNEKVPYIFSKYAEFFYRGLRDQKQIFNIVENSIISLSDKPIHIHFVIFLAMLYHRSSQIFRQVLIEKSLAPMTELEKKLPSGKVVIFRIPARNPSTGRASGEHINVGAKEIASVYFSILNDNKKLRDFDCEFNDFPKCLLLTLQNELRSGDMAAESPLMKYFHVVQHAGRRAEVRGEI